MHKALKPLPRLTLAGALIVVAFSVQPTSAQNEPYCECATNEFCANRHGGDTSWMCFPGACKEKDGKEGLCKKRTTACVPDPDAICPLIYAPVICDNGVTYSNQCFADADCATGCQPE